MLIFTLIKRNGKYHFPIAVEAGRAAEKEMFNLLDGYVDTETAIEASSWCDLATVGDEFEHEKFTIICEDI